MFLRAAATLLLAALLHPAGVLAQEAPPDYDEGIFQLRTPGLRDQPTSLLTLVSPAGEIFVPLGAVLSYVGIPSQTTAQAIRLEWPPPAWLTHLQLATGEVRRPDRAFALPEGSLVRRASEWYISLPALETLLEIRAEPFWETLSIQLTAPGDFPAERQLAIEARRLRLRQTELDPEEMRVPYAARTGGTGLDWSLAGSASGESTLLGGSLAAGVGLLGGALEAGGTAALLDERLELGSDPFVRYARNFPGNRVVQQMELGHVRAEGPLPLQLFGFRITNEPFVQPRLLGSILVQPVLPSGWEYEVYEGGQLVGVGTGDPGGAVEAPVRYGTTPLTVRMIGPSGQERTEQVLLLLPVTRVPPGALRYYAGAGECVAQTCSTYAAGELRYGLHHRLTAGIGVDALTGSRADGLRPHVAISASPFWTLNAELQARPGYVNASLQHIGGQRQSYSGRLLWTDESHPIGGLAGWRLDLAGQQALPRALGGRWLSLRLNLQADSTRELTAGQGSLGVPIARGFVYVQHEAGLQQDPVTSLRLFRSVRLGLPSPVGLSGSVGMRRGELGSVELTAFLPISQRMGGTAQLQWRPDQRPLVSLGYSARFGAALAQLRGSALRGTPTVSGSVRGGLAYSETVGLVGTPFNAVSRAGITGRVFLDRGGTGSYTPGVDLPLEGVEIRAAGRRMLSDAQGIYRGWDLQPYSATVVAVDTLGLEDADFTPRTPFVLVRPSPNVFNRVDIPLVRTREVVGALLRGEGVATVGGVSVRITNLETAEVTETRTFSDGEYYISRMRPGDYEVRVAESSLDALSAVSRPGVLRVHVPAQSEEFAVSLEPFRLVGVDAVDDGVRELSVALLGGAVRDAEAGRPLAALISATPVTGGTTFEAASDGATGRFSLALPTGRSYWLEVSAPGHLPEGAALDLTGAVEGDSLAADIALAPLRAGMILPLAGVEFEPGGVVLRGEPAGELSRILRLLAANPLVRVEVAGHTDDTGSPLVNQRLSRERAEAVASYLIARGIAADRIRARGYGPSEPLASNATEAGRQLNRRVEVRILELGER